MDQSFVPIFDGETLNGWSGDPRYWSVEDGVILGDSTGATFPRSNTFLIWQGGEPADFELKVEFKLHNHNSGIQFRSFPIKGKPWAVGGYQADIADNLRFMGAAYGERYKGLLAERGQSTIVDDQGAAPKVAGWIGESDAILAAIDPDGWNEYHITAFGSQVILRINGVTTAEFFEKSDNRLTRGLIALQLHGGSPMQVQFRNIRLRELGPGDKKRVLFLAGTGSHGRGAHEHHAGCRLLARCLNESTADIIAHVETEGKWPEPWAGYCQPDSVVMYCDGFIGHLAKDHQEKIQKLVDAGVGVACLHFATEVHPDELGDEFLEWIGGYFEVGWSVNPFWTAEFRTLPEHPITNGVEPFTLRDEWYYHMRFQPAMAGITPILSAVPPLRSLTSRSKERERGSNPTVMDAVEAGQPQHVAWAYERPQGGRGFGFTGGHMHRNWQNENFRRVVVNAIAWTAGAVIPEKGIESRPISEADLELNLDEPVSK